MWCEARRDQTAEDLRRVQSQVTAWVAKRRAADTAGQHATQLTSLETTLGAALRRLDEITDAVSGDLLTTYERCAAIDRQLVIVRRLWRWYADRFDQRDSEPARRVLAAADEVVWSVHAEAHRAHTDGAVPPAPLPYLDDIEAPEAVPRDEPARALRSERFDDVLTASLARLPVPLIGLPPTTVGAPWRLVLVGHEVGHHLLYDLAPRRAVLAHAGDAVAAAAGGPDEARWRAWSQEIVADLIGLVALGPASVTGLLDHELGCQDHMLDRGRARYPAPAVRLAVLGRAAAALKLPLPALPPLPELPADGRWDGVRDDLARAPAVADALVALDPAGSGPFATLFATDPADFRPGGRVARRAEGLVDGSAAHDTGLRTVRELTAAVVVAWQDLQAETDRGARRDGMAALGERFVETTVASREQDVRAAEPDAVAEPDAGLVRLLCGDR